jgi:protein-disulfide isomerase
MSELASDGVPVGEGPVRIDVYEDFLCPYCRRFEAEAGATLDELAAGGRAEVVYHPVAFLDRLSSTAYSSRAAAASGVAAEADRFRPFAKELFAHQPEEGGPGLPDDELTRLAAEAGVPGDATVDERHRDWAAYVTEQAIEAGVQGIPTVLVDGQQVDAGSQAILAAVG